MELLQPVPHLNWWVLKPLSNPSFWYTEKIACIRRKGGYLRLNGYLQWRNMHMLDLWDTETNTGEIIAARMKVLM